MSEPQPLVKMSALPVGISNPVTQALSLEILHGLIILFAAQ